MLILLVSTPHGLLCGTRSVPQTSVTVAATTAKAPCSILSLVFRPTRTGSTSWALTAPSLCGLRPRLSAVARKSPQSSRQHDLYPDPRRYRYWNSTPTGQQWAAIGFTSLIHGAIGKFMLLPRI